MAKQSKADKAIEARVSGIYHRSCSDIEISIFDIGKVMKVGVEAMKAGRTDEQVGEDIQAYVETIRKN